MWKGDFNSFWMHTLTDLCMLFFPEKKQPSNQSNMPKVYVHFNRFANGKWIIRTIETSSDFSCYFHFVGACMSLCCACSICVRVYICLLFSVVCAVGISQEFPSIFDFPYQKEFNQIKSHRYSVVLISHEYLCVAVDTYSCRDNGIGWTHQSSHHIRIKLALSISPPLSRSYLVALFPFDFDDAYEFWMKKKCNYEQMRCFV